MLTYEQFEKHIKVIEDCNEKDRLLGDIVGCEGIITYTMNATTSIVSLLEKIMQDEKNEWISYWLWELNFGRENHRLKVTMDGKEVPMTTIEDLYNVLAENINEAKV